MKPERKPPPDQANCFVSQSRPLTSRETLHQTELLFVFTAGCSQISLHTHKKAWRRVIKSTSCLSRQQGQLAENCRGISSTIKQLPLPLSLLKHLYDCCGERRRLMSSHQVKNTTKTDKPTRSLVLPASHRPQESKQSLTGPSSLIFFIQVKEPADGTCYQ